MLRETRVYAVSIRETHACRFPTDGVSFRRSNTVSNRRPAAPMFLTRGRFFPSSSTYLLEDTRRGREWLPKHSMPVTEQRSMTRPGRRNSLEQFLNRRQNHMRILIVLAESFVHIDAVTLVRVCRHHRSILRLRRWRRTRLAICIARPFLANLPQGLWDPLSNSRRSMVQQRVPLSSPPLPFRDASHDCGFNLRIGPVAVRFVVVGRVVDLEHGRHHARHI